jgi:hypothetical protein
VSVSGHKPEKLYIKLTIPTGAVAGLKISDEIAPIGLLLHEPPAVAVVI